MTDEKTSESVASKAGRFLQMSDVALLQVITTKEGLEDLRSVFASALTQARGVDDEGERR